MIVQPGNELDFSPVAIDGCKADNREREKAACLPYDRHLHRQMVNGKWQAEDSERCRAAPSDEDNDLKMKIISSRACCCGQLLCWPAPTDRLATGQAKAKRRALINYSQP